MGKNKKQTSKGIASLAAEILNDPSSSEIQKKFAGSALSQRKPNAETSEKLDAEAAKAIQSKKYSKETKALAASILSQSNGKE